MNRPGEEMASTMTTGEASPGPPPEPPAQRLATEAYVDKRIAELRADLDRAMLIQAAAIVGILEVLRRF